MTNTIDIDIAFRDFKNALMEGSNSRALRILNTQPTERTVWCEVDELVLSDGEKRTPGYKVISDFKEGLFVRYTTLMEGKIIKGFRP